MATLRTIRLRIKGTKNIKQITRAMEAVSGAKADLKEELKMWDRMSDEAWRNFEKSL